MTAQAHRYDIARKLMRLPDTAEGQPADVRAYIKMLPPKEREYWRGLVDWVEDYERAERALIAGNSKT